MKIVIKARTLKHAYARLRVAGFRVIADEEGNPLGKIEETCERCCTPHLTLDSGDVVFTVNVSEDKINKIPENETPNFQVLWREDQNTDEEWPMFTLSGVDAEGNPITWQQGAGRIA